MTGGVTFNWNTHIHKKGGEKGWEKTNQNIKQNNDW